MDPLTLAALAGVLLVATHKKPSVAPAATTTQTGGSRIGINKPIDAASGACKRGTRVNLGPLGMKDLCDLPDSFSATPPMPGTSGGGGFDSGNAIGTKGGQAACNAVGAPAGTSGICGAVGGYVEKGVKEIISWF